MSRSNQQLRITVTPIRNRKPKNHHELAIKASAKAYADKLLDLLQDECVVYISDSEIFVSTVVQAARDVMNRVNS